MAKSHIESSIAPVEETSIGSFRNVLRNRPFLLLWLAQLISQIGFNAANYGVIAIVTEVTRSTVMVGFAIVSFTLPAVSFSLLAGVYVDYLDKRLVLWVSNALRAVATSLIVVALIWNPHTVIPLYILAFVISFITQFFMPAEAAAIPLLVGKKELVPALSLFNITLTMAQAIGFLLLGRVISTIFPPFFLHLGFTKVLIRSIDMLFVVVAIGYVICALLILAIPARAIQQELRPIHELPVVVGKHMVKKVRADIVESWKYIYKDRSLLLALLQVSFVSIILLVVGEIAGPFVQNVLHLPVENMTVLFAPAGFGLVLGGLFMPYLTKWLGKQRTVTLGSICTAIGFILLPLGRYIFSQVAILAPWIPFFVGVMAFILGATLDMVNIPAQAVMQERTPEEVRGRVFSFQSMFYNAGSIPVILFAGVIADTLGIETVMYLLALSIFGFQLWARRYAAGAGVY